MTEYYSLLEDLMKLADLLLDSHALPKNEKESLLLFSVGKTHKTLNAIILLCKNGMGQDAAILSRSIFELSLISEYIITDRTDRRSKRFFSYDWIQRKNMIKYLEGTPEFDQHITPLERSEIINVEKKAKEAQLEFDYKNFTWRDKSLYNIAKDLNKLILFSTAYQIQCTLVHSNPRAVNYYIKEEDGGMIVDSGPSNDFIEETLASSFIAYHSILELFNDHFKKDKSRELKILSRQFQQLVKR